MAGKVGLSKTRNFWKKKGDRLSSLPDDILIGIISQLPFQLAIVTGTLSSRWRGFWKNITSINIDTCTSIYAHYQTMLKIISPNIRSFSFECLHRTLRPHWPLSLDTCLQYICDCDIREVKLTWRNYYREFNIVNFPSVIFRTQSLVSIELGSTFPWELPDGCEPINLPNLKNLSINLCPSTCEWVEKQIKLCPSLEQLSLTWAKHRWNLLKQQKFIISLNQNLRRLSIIDFGYANYTIVIDAPAIEYLAICAPNLSSISFAKEPVMLREAKIKTTNNGFSSDEKKVILRFYKDISNVRFLKLYMNGLDSVSTVVFRNTTRLTLDMHQFHDIRIALSLLELFPVLHVLTLKYHYIGCNKLYFPSSSCGKVIKLHRVLKRFEIQCCLHSNDDSFASSFLFFVQFLSSSIDFDHFKFNVAVGLLPENVNAIAKNNVSVELELCKLLYHCPTISEGCEVEFVGRCFTMSRKAGPKVKTIDGKVIPFGSSTWNSIWNSIALLKYRDKYLEG